MTDKELNSRLQIEFNKGVEHGISLMEQKMIVTSQNGNPIEIDGRAYFIKDDMDYLRERFYGMEGRRE